jgi:iron complex outermembrane receptor protein
MIYDISNTLNASIANKDLLAGGKGVSPSSFNAGGFSFEQLTTNLDFNRYFDGLVGRGLNVAFGGEYRHENYKIFAGELGSYNDADGVGVGGNAGSQGFPGFQPADEVNANRHSTAAYLDLEADLTDTVKARRGALREIQRLRLDHHRQAGWQLARGADRAAARFGLDRLPRTVAAADVLLVDLHRLHRRRADRRGAGAEQQRGHQPGRHPKLKEGKSTSFTLGSTWTPTRRVGHRRPVPDQDQGPHRAVGPL